MGRTVLMRKQSEQAELATRVPWAEAWERARPLLEGVERGRVAASQPGVELAYLDFGGEGELVTLHHANGFCAAMLALVAAGLRERFRVVAFDARGHGDSTAVDPDSDPEAYAWTRMAEDYRAALEGTLERTGHSRVALGIGHSFGGVLSLHVAAARPGLFERVLLCDPVILPRTAPGEPPPPGRSRELSEATRRRRRHFASPEDAYDHFASRGLFREFRAEALALYVAEGLAPDAEGGLRLKCAPEVEAAIFAHSGRIDVFGIAGRIETPVRFLHASRGDFSRDVYDELALEMPDARVESCDAGHLFPMEQPEQVLERIEAP